MKPTPPPWTAQCDKAGKPGAMALVVTSAKGARCRAIDCTGSGETYAEDCANARLIATAPDMRKALHNIAFGLQTAAEMRELARSLYDRGAI